VKDDATSTRTPPTTASDSRPARSFLSAAMAVLERSGREMTTTEIVDTAMAEGLLRPEGRTPLASMRATLYGAVGRDPHTRLVRVAISGPRRAVRGTVRWKLRRSSSGDGHS
jgi:hypothetical protein